LIVISKFIEYLRSRSKTDVVRPPLPKRDKRKYIPHAFTQDELKRFFLNCDNLPDTPISLRTQVRRITVPVFFRLMYSSGLRVCEARLLRVEDVDLSEGVLNVRHSKGPDQHYVALHDTMLTLMKKFDEDMQLLEPNRKYFFQSAYTGKPVSTEWVRQNFTAMWTACSDAHAVPYDLRHNYAVENINQWIGGGYDFSRFVYLSKSMGHREFESTKYYFHLVPAFADILEELSGQAFDDMIPEVDYAEI
jgi:integrase